MSLLLLIFLVAFALRLYRLGYQSIWYDEAVSIHLAMKDLRGLTQHTAGDIHPPLYYYLLHFWTKAAGTSEFSAAFLSLVFGILIIAGCYRLGTDLYDRRVGLLTAFLVGVSPFNLWYSQEIRMYTLGAFLGLVSLYCLIRLADLTGRDDQAQSVSAEASIHGRGGKWKLWIGYVLSAVAGLYTLYYFAFLLVFENLLVSGWRLASRRARRDPPAFLRRWVLAQLLVVLLYLPWLPVALRQALDPPVPPWRSFTGLGSVILESWTALSLGQSVDPESLLVWPVLSFMFALYLLGVRGVRTESRGPLKSILLCGYTFVPLFFIYLLSLRTPLFHVRYAFTYSPPFYLLLAVGLAGLMRSWRLALPIGLTVIALACGYSTYRYHFDPQYAADDHRGAVSYMEKGIAPGDAVLVNAGYAYPAFLYYYEGGIAWRGRLTDYQPENRREGLTVLQTGSIGGDSGLGWGDPDSDFYATSEEETARALERVFAYHDRVWVYRIYDTVTDPEGFIREWLDDHGRLLGQEEFAGESYMRVQCYLTAREPEYDAEPRYHSLDLDVVDGLKLAGYSAQPVVRAGDHLPVTLHWQTAGEKETVYGVRLGLALERQAPEDGIEVASSSVSLLDEESPSQESVLEIPSGTPPLDYSLIIHLYDASAGGNPDLLAAGLEIGTIRVVKPLIPASTPAMPHEPWANFGDLLQLTGYDLPALEIEQGGEIELQLLWRAWGVPLLLIRTEMELRDSQGLGVTSEAVCLADRYPSTVWEREELVGDLCRVEVPEEVSSGSYELTIRLEGLSPTGKWETVPFWSTAGWEETFDLGMIEVIEP
jgi:4-amino-4-deoxy-L-arabinose transferase-like glycosyltransferase